MACYLKYKKEVDATDAISEVAMPLKSQSPVAFRYCVAIASSSA